MAERLRPSRAPSNRRAVAASSRFRVSVGSTTVTRGLRDCRTSIWPEQAEQQPTTNSGC